MRILMRVSVLGRTGTYRRGEIVDIPESEALRLIRRGMAVEAGRKKAPGVSEETRPEVEAAALPGPEETASEGKPRRKRKAT